MSEYEPVSTFGWSQRKTAIVGLVALLPPLVYVIGTWGHPGHGRPFMFSNLWGPDSSHSTVGLILIFTGMIFSSMLSAGLGIWLAQRAGSRRIGWFLFVVGLALLVISLMTRQPYSG